MSQRIHLHEDIISQEVVWLRGWEESEWVSLHLGKNGTKIRDNSVVLHLTQLR